MTCADCVGQLTHHHTGVLAAPARRAADEHLAGCPDCAAFAGQLLATDTLLRREPRAARLSGLCPCGPTPSLLPRPAGAAAR